MTRVVFEYSADFNRPVAEVIIQNGKHKYKFLSIIDSGADRTTIPKDVGELLNLEPIEKKEIKKLTGIGGAINAVLRNVRLEIGDYNFSADVFWLFENEGHFLLGRDVFERFDILFKQNPEKKVIFESDKGKLG